MNYPWTRHYQRYEYVGNKGYITDKEVMDIGAGTAFGSNYLTLFAKKVYAVDPKLTEIALKIKDGKQMYSVEPSTAMADTSKRFIAACSFEKLVGQVKVDVAVCIEVFEHMEDPLVFVDNVSKVAESAFFTTPLVGRTIKKPENKEHIAEYSQKDFFNILSSKFVVNDMAYQFADLTIREGMKNIKSRGHSLNDNHVVQMAWCRRK